MKSNTDACSSPRCGKNNISVQTLLRCPYRLRMQSNVSVLTLKVPDTGSQVPLFGHTKILYTLIRKGGAALAAAVP